jgi:hypothetical protein
MGAGGRVDEGGDDAGAGRDAADDRTARGDQTCQHGLATLDRLAAQMIASWIG